MNFQLKVEAPNRVLEFGRLLYDRYSRRTIHWWSDQEAWQHASDFKEVDRFEAHVLNFLYELRSAWIYNIFSFDGKGIDPTVLRVVAFTGHVGLVTEHGATSMMQIAYAIAKSGDSSHLLDNRRLILRLCLRKLLSTSTFGACYHSVTLGEAYVAFFTGDPKAGAIVVTDAQLSKGDFSDFVPAKNISSFGRSTLARINEKSSITIVPGMPRSLAARNQREYKGLCDFVALAIREGRVGDIAGVIHKYAGNPRWGGPAVMLAYLFQHARAEHVGQVLMLLEEFLPECPSITLDWLLQRRCEMSARFGDVQSAKIGQDQRIRLQPPPDDCYELPIR